MYTSTYTIVPGEQQVTQERYFDAPRELVFTVFTDPALLAQWWGPARYTTTVERMDVREGGSWRFIQADGDGREFAFNGLYHVVDAPHQVVQTFEFEGLPERHVILETMTLDDVDGRTLMTQRSVFQSVEDRDGMLASGMQDGSTEANDRLEALLESLR
jgi:uncharacterized protein YndB with AHSA1/START domain